MAIFSKKSDKTDEPKAAKVVKTKKMPAEKAEKKEKAAKTPAVKTVATKDVTANEVAAASNSNPVILEPHVTEKASIQSEASNIYTFKVAKNSTKLTIARAIKIAYKVTPLSVRIARRPEKPINYRGRPVMKSGFKKAFVHLKKGDKIEFA